jgi:hypothetical protein
VGVLHAATAWRATAVATFHKQRHNKVQFRPAGFARPECSDLIRDVRKRDREKLARRAFIFSLIFICSGADDQAVRALSGRGGAADSSSSKVAGEAVGVASNRELIVGLGLGVRGPE